DRFPERPGQFDARKRADPKIGERASGNRSPAVEVLQMPLAVGGGRVQKPGRYASTVALGQGQRRERPPESVGLRRVLAHLVPVLGTQGADQACDVVQVQKAQCSASKRAS